MRGSPRNCGAMLCCLSLIASPFVHSDEPVLVYPDLPSLVKQQALQDALSASSYIVHNLDYAEDVAIDWEGGVHVTAYHSGLVFKFNGSTGAFVAAYGRGFVDGPVGIACGPEDGDMYVASYRSNQVLRFTAGGKFIGVAVGAKADGASRRTSFGDRRLIYSPTGLAFDPHDGRTLYVLSYVGGSVARFNNSGAGARTFWRVV